MTRSEIHEDPRAYLLGVEGLALLRAFRGEHGADFVEERVREIRAVLDDPALADAAVDVERIGTVDGYQIWSSTYDDPGNAAFGLEAPLVHEMLDGLPPGRALDAACGTGPPCRGARRPRPRRDRGGQLAGHARPRV